MDDPRSHLHHFLERLAQRERRLLGARALLQAGVAVAVGLLLLSVGLSFGLGRWAAVGLAAGVGVAGLALALAWPLALRWRAAGQALAQARGVERVRPALQQRLVTVVDHAQRAVVGAKPAPRGVSEVLLHRAAARALTQIEGLSPAEVHPATPVQRAGLATAASLVVLLAAGALLPVGPLDAVGVALGGSAAAARMADAATEVADERAIVGDIVLRYVYPDYTGIEPFEVPNSDGTIHAPPGTVVHITATTAEPFDAAALQVDTAPPVDAALSGGRGLAASLVVQESGAWRLLLFRGNAVVRSPDYAIVAEADAPPVVALLQNRDTASVPVDRPLSLGWSVQDDFGLDRVIVEVEHADGRVTEHALRTPLDAPRALEGGIGLTPRQLGMKPGETAKLRVVAVDNDVAQGGKRGVSAEWEFTATGPRGRGRRLTAYYRRLRDAMLPIVAAFLVEEVPPARSNAGMTRWVSDSRERFTALQDLQRQQWGEETPTSIDGVLVDEVLSGAASLFRFTLTTWEPGTNRRVTDADRSTFANLHADEIDRLERAIYTLDEMLQRVALQELVRQVEEVAREASEVASMAEDADAAQLLARLDQLERMMAQVQRSAQQLGEGQLSEFLNARLEQTQNLSQAIREAIAEGRMDDARELLQQLAEQLQQMAESMGDQMASQQQGEDELGEAYEQAMEDLRKLEQDQQQLADELQEARERFGDDVAEQLDAWSRLDQLAELAAGRSGDIVDGTGDGRGWMVESIRWAERLAQATGGLQDAVRARDVDGAVRRLRDAERPLGMAQRNLVRERRRDRLDTEPLPQGVDGGIAAAEEVGVALQEMARLLEQLEQLRQADDPELQQAAQELAAQQAELRERAEQVGSDVQRVEQAMPTSNGAASDAMGQAEQAMERAQQALQEGESMPGEGHQRDAARRVGEAREQLERQMQQHQQMQQSMQQMQGEQQQGDQQGEGEQRDGEGASERQRVEIPAPEDFPTPEAYRRALLEGMQGDVPEEFEALKQRYYEELVRQ